MQEKCVRGYMDIKINTVKHKRPRLFKAALPKRAQTIFALPENLSKKIKNIELCLEMNNPLLSPINTGDFY